VNIDVQPGVVKKADLLETILAATAKIVDTRKAVFPRSALELRAREMHPRGEDFRKALARRNKINVIAECKRRSPSKGVLCEDYDPVVIAREFASAGATAVSVLTEPTFFDGSLSHLESVRRAVDLPVLRKDFTICEYQLLEARAAGADAVLLIVAALDDKQLSKLHAKATELDLAVLVEVHNHEELRRAIDAGSRIVGVNNRDLRTLAVDVRTSETLIELMPKALISVAESGLSGRADVERLHALGFQAFLIGEGLIARSEPGLALSSLLGN
jgi:indole-3-glycerol phosphate synthase